MQNAHNCLDRVQAKSTEANSVLLLLKGVFRMGRAHGHKTRDKNKASLPQVPKNMKSDGLDVEFDRDLADHDDLEAMARSKAADQRAKNSR
ncbi:hypothetical protein B14911_14355 [Bacillus sp. NRRL B-14911]|nr:hypothetical protein B14911_14355 [Bacillus sp. NRRL B-14911]